MGIEKPYLLSVRVNFKNKSSAFSFLLIVDLAEGTSQDVDGRGGHDQTSVFSRSSGGAIRKLAILQVKVST